MNSGDKKKDSSQESSTNGSSSGVGDLSKSQFKEILSLIENTDLEYVQLEKNGKKICLRRSSQVGLQPQKGSVAEPETKEKEIPATYSIRSPIVGRFWSSMGADRPSLVVEGESVTAGQKVAVVEAMKIKKEVFSAYTGKISRILVRDGDPVEYGQELFIVEPEQEIRS